MTPGAKAHCVMARSCVAVVPVAADGGWATEALEAFVLIPRAGIAVDMRLPTTCAVLFLAACGAPADHLDAATDVRRVTVLEAPLEPVKPVATTLRLRLDERSGTAAIGWALAPVGRLPAERAQLTLNAWDCGARGRWVQILAGKDVTFCSRAKAERVADVSTDDADCVWDSSFEAGGSGGDFTGTGVLVRLEGQRLGRLRVSKSSQLASDWYAHPIAPFEVELEFLSDVLAAR